jgi:hypothetical protein
MKGHSTALFFCITVASNILVQAGFSATINTVTVTESAFRQPLTPVFSGTLILCEAFDTGTQSCSGKNVSDYLQFGGGGILSFVSDVGFPPDGDPYDTGIPCAIPSVNGVYAYIPELFPDQGTETLKIVPLSS